MKLRSASKFPPVLCSLTGSAGIEAVARDDPWTQRMRDKYGLDAAAFRTSPSAPTATQLAMEDHAQRSGRQRSRCTVM